MKILFFYLSISLLLISCGNQPPKNDYLIRVFDLEKEEYGYVNSTGDTIIPLGKYSLCFTDTLKTYAIVTSPEKGKGLIAIDRNENVKYEVFNFDNGPDYPSEGLFRIIQNNKIGYADVISGEIIIKSEFTFARPFKNGIAEVTDTGEEKPVGEYHEWISDEWYYIDKTGTRIDINNEE